MRNCTWKYNTQLVKSLHHEKQRSGIAVLSVPTLSLGNGLRVLISLFWGDNHRAHGELGKGRTELCTIKGTFETGGRPQAAGRRCSSLAGAVQHREK